MKPSKETRIKATWFAIGMNTAAILVLVLKLLQIWILSK